MNSRILPGHRRPTFHFLSLFDNRSTVHLATSVDMERVLEDRKRSGQSGSRTSYISYVVWAAGRAVAQFPEANAGFHDSWRGPRIAYYSRVGAKVTFDRLIDGHRVVSSHFLPDADKASLAELQERIDYFRDTPPAKMPELTPYRLLERLPLSLGRLMYRSVFRNESRRYEAQGSFTVTSLGHRSITDFYPVISTATCFSVGAIQDEPVARDGEVVVKPMLRLCFSFDHRLIDGVIAAEILAAVKERLEHFESA
jgi:pyruvate/2-oxoglutarate dehydrogenase complex dihydrolipoamide acyltransferase (E2) component